MSFRSVSKYLTGFVLRPAVKFYLRKERQYNYNGIDVTVKPNVFHPGLFFSTKILLGYLKTIDVNNKTCLELGCGSGLISCYLAKNKAIVTASDISTNAIENAKTNAALNHLNVEIILSDLFDSISERTFDYIIINPPFYLKSPLTENDFAWYAGENGAYFVKLFLQLNEYIRPASHILIILSDECDIDFINAEAQKNKLRLNAIFERKRLWDNFTIYEATLIA